MRTALRTLALGLFLLAVPLAALADADLAATLAGLDAQIAAAPEDPALWRQRADIERLRGNLERAAADLSRAEALGLPAALAGRDHGILLVAAGRSVEAEARFRAARRLAPQDVRILLPHARSLVALGRFREAADTYAILVTQAPDAGPDVHLERIRALGALGPDACDEAMRAADAAIALRGPVPSLEQAALGVALAAGRTNLALARLERMIAAANRTETLLLQKASILEQAGRPEDAATAYGAALAALESLPPARRATPAAAEVEAQARRGVTRVAAPTTSQEAAVAVRREPR